MNIKVFGPGCSKCHETERIVTSAVKESGIPATVEKISDIKEMLAHGIMYTPAVAVDGKIVCTGHVPTRQEVLEWLKGQNSVKTGTAASCSCGGKC